MSKVSNKLRPLLQCWNRLVPGDTIYKVSNTEIEEHTIEMIKKYESHVKIKLTINHFITIRDDVINYANDKWGNGKKEATDNYFVDKFRAERQLNENIDEQISVLYQQLENTRSTIKSLKNKYVTL